MAMRSINLDIAWYSVRYWNDPEALQKFGRAMGVGPSGAAAGAEAEAEEEEEESWKRRVAEEEESESWRRRVASAAFYRRVGSGAPKMTRVMPPFHARAQAVPVRASFPPPLERGKTSRAR